MEKPKSMVEIKNFPGLATSVDPHDRPPGASQVQTNLQSTQSGELRVRRGYRKVSFEDD